MQTFKEMAVKSLNNLSNPQMSMYMNYVYYTGLAQTYALNKIRPEWRNELF